MKTLRNIAQEVDASSIPPASTPPTTCFSIFQQNSTTWRIVEDDKYGEYPFIYVKITKHAIVLVDTGCGGAVKDAGKVELKELRKFLETYPVYGNAGEDGEAMPLNPNGGKDYLVVCSHCHYDHIGAIQQFTDSRSTIWASSYDKTFLDSRHLPTSSLCRFLNIPTPKYSITNSADDGVALTHKDHDLGLIVYQTPGHTPDELALWDPSERTLYVGDTLYEWAPIIFPKEGNLITYSDSIERLRHLVKEFNSHLKIDTFSDPKKVMIACGHTTADADAELILLEVDDFLWDVVSGKVEVGREEEDRGEVIYLYEKEDGKLSFLGPRRLFDEFREDVEAMRRLERRVSDGV
jgi:glyoxylase-like metal-dependent hydrolase (beta-lactamase superfamily II)